MINFNGYDICNELNVLSYYEIYYLLTNLIFHINNVY